MGLDDTAALTCLGNLLAASRAYLIGGKTRAQRSRWLTHTRWLCWSRTSPIAHSGVAPHCVKGEGHTRRRTCSCSAVKSEHQAPDILLGRRPMERDRLLYSLLLHIAYFFNH